MRKVSARWVWLTGCVLVAACKKEEAPAPPPSAEAEPAAPRAETPPSPADEAGPGATDSDAGEPPGSAAGAGQAPSTEDAPGTTDAPGTQAAAPAPVPSEAVAPENPKNREWTAGVVDLRRASLKPVTLRAVRAARNEDFDRVVFEFDGPQVPGYHVEYIDSPVRKCGSGDTTAVAGQGWLQVRLTPAQAHADGHATVTEREQKPKLPVLQELELTCDFEGEVTWVLGNSHPNKYRVLELREPTRLVVDVRH